MRGWWAAQMFGLGDRLKVHRLYSEPDDGLLVSFCGQASRTWVATSESAGEGVRSQVCARVAGTLSRLALGPHRSRISPTTEQTLVKHPRPRTIRPGSSWRGITRTLQTPSPERG